MKYYTIDQTKTDGRPYPLRQLLESGVLAKVTEPLYRPYVGDCKHRSRTFSAMDTPMHRCNDCSAVDGQWLVQVYPEVER